MAKIVLLPHGTAGDVLPYIWLGRLLLKRGHQVSMIWIESFRKAAERAGLKYVAMKDDGFDEILKNPLLWKPHQGLKLGFEYAGHCIGDCITAFEEDMECDGRPDLLVAPNINFAAHLLREKLGVPLISVVLHAMAFVSAHEVPGGLPAGGLLRMQPLFLRRIILSLAAPYDRHALPTVRRYCLEHGVKPPRHLQRGWWHSPDGVLALFPEWYAKPQPDWPKNTFQWDFPLEDLAETKPCDPALNAFLEAGDKPVVFTLGTGFLHARQFFETAAELVTKLGCRAVFVTRDREQAPALLPASIFVAAYAPFSTLLPRAAVFVHHGGIGTLSQCFAAGLPQFIVSMAFDQPDNAERVRRLGVGVSLDIRHFNVRKAEPLLKRCLENEAMRQAAAEVRRRVLDRPDEAALIDWLETRMHLKKAASLVGRE